MATANINVRVDSSLKQAAESLFSDLGLNMSTAITMFLKSAVSHNGIPFEVKRQVPNAETAAALAEYEEMKKDKFYVVRKHIYGTIYMVNPYVYGAYTTTAKIFRF